MLNGQQQGPYGVEQLRGLGIGPQTPVWYAGLNNWMPAGQAPATAHLFAGVPPRSQMGYAPQSPRHRDTNQPARYVNTYIGWSIANVIVNVLGCSGWIGLIPAIVALVYSSQAQSALSSGFYDRARSNANKAKWWNIITILVTIAVIVICLILFMAPILAALGALGLGALFI